MSTIKFEDVEVVFDQRRVLSPINLTLSESRIGIIGANGGGKSTLVRLINGLGAPTSGRVLVDGLDVAEKPKDVRRKVGYVFPDAENQIVMPSVREDVEFSLRKLRLPKDQRRQAAEEMLERFGLMSHAEDSPHTLSSGQKQLLALSSVLVMRPELIIADEPTTLLDLRNRMKIRRIFSELEQQLIVVSHDLDFVEDFDRVLCIHEGGIWADGSPAEVVSAYRELMQSE